MIASGIAAAALAGLGMVTGAAGLLVGLIARARSRGDRIALRAAHERETAQREASRRLAGAVRISAAAVLDVTSELVRLTVPAIDAVLVYDEHDGALSCVHADGAGMQYFAGTRIAFDDTAALAAAARSARRIVRGRDDASVRPHPRAVDAVAVPLLLDAGRIAVLIATSSTALPYAAGTQLGSLADHAAAIYQLALDRAGDRRRAEFDGLTGLITPHAFRAQFAARMERARHVTGARGALLFLDTDNFKRWNDVYGHGAGDALLRAVARTLRSAARPDDLAARNGGDEFCLVLEGSGKADAIARADEIRRAIAALDFAALRPPGAGAALTVTASIGVAAYPADGADAATLLERADAAMYHTKRSGRDGVAYCEPDGTFTRLAEVLETAR